MNRVRPRFARLLLDVDSTLCALEGIDQLARAQGAAVAARVAALTERAMAGELPLERVYARRLALVRPDAAALARLGKLYVRRLVPGMARLVADARRAGVEVVLLSGGLRPALLPLLERLGLPGSALFAVDVELDAHGRFARFDRRSPLVRSDGKREVAARLAPAGGKSLLVGDGASDAAARPAVDAFCAFTAVASRPKVVARADHVARDATALRRLLRLR
ncbi:MAG: HAD-IB family phosphatase [Planctomycetes bacterium]|nr:HAD-IB family phosphatase [Planctomycetota bacterium]